MKLDAYLQRIGYTKSLTPTLDVLRDIAFHHAITIPFENLNPFLGLPVSLELADVERKLVDEQRGGYCFEQNLLLSEALSAIGFQVSGLAARVLWMQPEDSITPRSHRVLLVEAHEHTYVVDVGFGGLTLTGALELVQNIEQATPHELFRLVPVDDHWRMQAKLGDSWRTLYRFDLLRQHPIDYKVMNYFTATHPTSHFVHDLVAARPTPVGRYALRNREFSFRGIDGTVESRVLADVNDIRAVLQNEFQIKLPTVPQLDERLGSLP